MIRIEFRACLDVVILDDMNPDYSQSQTYFKVWRYISLY